jgi:hypothetical protein
MEIDWPSNITLAPSPIDVNIISGRRARRRLMWALARIFDVVQRNTDAIRALRILREHAIRLCRKHVEDIASTVNERLRKGRKGRVGEEKKKKGTLRSLFTSKR